MGHDIDRCIMKVKAVSLILVVLVFVQVIDHQSLAVKFCQLRHSDSSDHYFMDTDSQFVECPGIKFGRSGDLAGGGGGSRGGGRNRGTR